MCAKDWSTRALARLFSAAAIAAAAGTTLVGCPEEGFELRWCRTDGECDDGVFCNGRESCSPRSSLASAIGCLPGTPCAGSCNETREICTGASCRNDEECSDGLYCTGQEWCDRSGSFPGGRGVCVATDDWPCSADQICNEVDARCDDALCEDRDGDGHRNIECGGDDCDDFDRERFPGRPEVCNVDAWLHDEDCDWSTVGPASTNGEPEGESDSDGDGFVDDRCCNEGPSGDLNCGRDCDDEDADVHPFQRELCNGVDDDCDGAVDEGLLVSLHPDEDRDGFGNPLELASVCSGTPGYSDVAGDCDDENPHIIPGSIVCVPGEQGLLIDECVDGAWVRTSCSEGHICVIQPAGHGVCVIHRP